MSASSEEQLSALLDNGLPEAEAGLVVRRLCRNPDLRELALRYCLVGDVLRDELPPAGPVDLVSRVHAALEPEPEAPHGRRGRFGRMAAGVAVAASVAVVALLALPGRQPAEPALSVNEIAAPPATELQVAPALTRPAGGGPDRLTRYYVNHTEYAPLMGGRGALTRILATQPQDGTVEDRLAADEPASIAEDESRQ
jgi:hypothetical protein